MINISGLLLKLYGIVGAHKLDKVVGLYPKGKRYPIKTARDFGMSNEEFISKVKQNPKGFGLDNVSLSYYTFKPSRPVALGRLLYDAIEGLIYHLATDKRMIYECRVTGDDIPLLENYYMGNKNIDAIVEKLFEKYYGECDDNAHFIVIKFITSLGLEPDYLYDIDLDSDFLVVRKRGSFKDERYDYLIHNKRLEDIHIEHADMGEINGVFDGTKIN